MKIKTAVSMLGSIAWLMAADIVAAQTPVPAASAVNRPPADPNEKVCEDQVTVGSRLATKRICATRAEWAERRKQDRDSIEAGQRAANIGCNTVNTHTGAPSC